MHRTRPLHLSATALTALAICLALFAAPVLAQTQAETPGPEQRLKSIYGSFPKFSAVKVEVVHGVAHLTGTAENGKAVERAAELARSLDGVDYVINDLELSADVPERVAPLMDNLGSALIRAWEYLPILGLALALFIGFVLLAMLLARWNWLFTRLSLGNMLVRSLFMQLARTLVIIVGLVVVLDLLGLTGAVGAVVGAAGLFGLGLSFGLKDIIENYMSGVLLSFRSPFALEDWIRVGEHSGSVVRMTSRELVLMNLSGNHIRIPNAEVFKNVIYNYTRNPLRQFQIDVGIGTSENLIKARRLGLEALAGMKGVMEDPPPFMRIKDLADFTVAATFYGWVDQREHDYLKVRSEAIRLIKDALDAAGVEMPVPTQQITVRREVPDLQAEPESRAPDIEQVMDSARSADVEREDYLDRQIESDRSESREEDLLSRHKRP